MIDYDVRIGALLQSQKVSPEMQLLHQYKIFINGQTLLKDFSNYHWKTNLTGEVLPVPDHKHSHGPDAVRYAISYSMRAKIRLI